jgi:ribosomal protein L6P/L9E
VCRWNVLKVSGPKGELTRGVTGDVAVVVDAGVVTITKTKETPKSRALWGTYAAHIHNMIKV